MVAVVGVVSDVQYPYLDQSPIHGSFDDTLMKWPLEHGRKEGEDVYVHSLIFGVSWMAE
jgi:hypothetical protein